MKISVVTGNPNKLEEIKQIAPPGFEFKARQIDLPEIQSLDLKEIIRDKAIKAYGEIKGPVIVEDVSAGLDGLAGLPGPFYKFFRKELGDIILVKLANISGPKVTVRCLAAYYDGSRMIFGEGVINGTVVEPRGKNGFGFDIVIVPSGHKKTMAEMTAQEKHEISHRGKAFKALFSNISKT